MIAPNRKLNIILNIDISLARNVKYLCKRFPENEWSGILLYDIVAIHKNTEGYFDEIILNGRNMILQNIGSQVYTEFDEDTEKIWNTIGEIGALDCNRGLIHSHNTMPTFFSQTDLKTLEEHGDAGSFLSLICNNDGYYNAMLSAPHVKKTTIQDSFWGDLDTPIETEWKNDISLYPVKIVKPNETISDGNPNKHILQTINELTKK